MVVRVPGWLNKPNGLGQPGFTLTRAIAPKLPRPLPRFSLRAQPILDHAKHMLVVVL
jgi:hypothetical protein